MRWLIVEDALRDQKGHWFEYVQTFVRSLSALNDTVEVWSDRKAEPFVTKALASKPILPESIWHRMSDNASRLTRYARVPLHAAASYRRISKALRRSAQYDVIFVPTVMVHHLLAWYLLLKTKKVPNGTTLLLFFPNLPIELGIDGVPRWINSPTTKLLAVLLRWLRPQVLQRTVILGVETPEMQTAFASLAGCRVVYLPHPVSAVEVDRHYSATQPLVACYGAARHEKGSDTFQCAIKHLLRNDRVPVAKFAIQWLDDFEGAEGQIVTLIDELRYSPLVDVINRYFTGNEYQERLAVTNIMVLPYRRNAYGLRVSRVVIEAIVSGIPVLVTKGTTLASQMTQFGAGESFSEDAAIELAAQIEKVAKDYQSYQKKALSLRPSAAEHFSVKNFKNLLLKSM